MIIQTNPKPACISCGQPGNVLYSDLQDRLFGAPGKWTLRKCSNTRCGLVWLDPAPREDELWKTYATYYTHQESRSIQAANTIKKAYFFIRDCYLSVRFGYFSGQPQARFKYLGLAMYLFPGRRADVDFTVMYLPARQQGRLLEIGCGSGIMLNYMDKLGWKTEGIDVDQSAVANAQGKGLNVSLGSLEQQNYQTDSFDAVMLSHVIEHVPDPKSLLRECHRILKPGGMLTMVTPNNESIGCRVYKRSWMHLDPPRHLILYNCRTFDAFAREAGFTGIQTHTTIRDAHSLFWGSYSIHRHGTFTMGSQPPRSVKLLMQLLRLVEGGLIKIFPRIGEEISLTGIKK